MSDSAPRWSSVNSKDQLWIGAVVLAAGASTRLGEPKQLLLLDGKPLIQRTIDSVLQSPAWPVVVVVGASADKVRPLLSRQPVLIAENPAWAEGMASSLRAGVATLQQFSRAIDGVLVTLCDQPSFSPAVVAQLMAVQSATGRSIVASHYNGRNGAPAIFLREHFPALMALTGEEGARTLLNTPSERLAHVDLPALAVDIDTPADVAALREKRPD